LAYKHEENRLCLHASLSAQPAFAAIGFRVARKEVIKISNQSLERAEMEKQVDDRSVLVAFDKNDYARR